MKKYFSLLLGKFSPAIEHTLAGEKDYKAINEISDSIASINIIERICYNYQSHEFAPLEGWHSLNQLTSTQQHEEILDPYHYDKFKTIVEFCKAIGNNFASMCTANVDMVIKILNDTSEMDTKGTFTDGAYFKLDPDDRKLVDDPAEEIYLATRFLSLSSKKLPS